MTPPTRFILILMMTTTAYPTRTSKMKERSGDLFAICELVLHSRNSNGLTYLSSSALISLSGGKIRTMRIAPTTSTKHTGEVCALTFGRIKSKPAGQTQAISMTPEMSLTVRKSASQKTSPGSKPTPVRTKPILSRAA